MEQGIKCGLQSLQCRYMVSISRLLAIAKSKLMQSTYCGSRDLPVPGLPVLPTYLPLPSLFYSSLSAGLPAVRPTSARCMAPVLSIRKVSVIQTCCLKIYPLRHCASFHSLKFSHLQETTSLLLLMHQLFII